VRTLIKTFGSPYLIIFQPKISAAGATVPYLKRKKTALKQIISPQLVHMLKIRFYKRLIVFEKQMEDIWTYEREING
jgi:hypothetical protein